MRALVCVVCSQRFAGSDERTCSRECERRRPAEPQGKTTAPPPSGVRLSPPRQNQMRLVRHEPSSTAAALAETRRIIMQLLADGRRRSGS